MPKLDKQRRLKIPLDFRDELSWVLPAKVALCYDCQTNMIYICEKDKSTSELVICFRTIDAKGRFIFPTECIRLLNASDEDFLILFLQNKKIFIKKA